MQRRVVVGLALGILAVVAACSSSSDSAPGPGPISGDDAGVDGTSPGGDSSAPDGQMLTDGEVPDTYVPPPPVYVSSTHETTTYGGQTRLYDLSIPVDYDMNKAYPLVLSFHGSPATADGMLAGAPFDRVSKTDAIVAYPQAIAVDADGGFDWDLTLSSSNADMGFTKALVDLLAGKYNIDRTKVYGYGYSGGGFFVNMLSCTMPGTLRAFASQSGGAPYKGLGSDATYPNTYVKCSDSEVPVAALIMQGMNDNTVTYGSGTFESSYWGYVNGCADDTTPVTPVPCAAHNGCAAATPVVFCGVPGVGHEIWSESFATSWAFFLALP